MIADAATCPECATPLVPGALDGLCPRCLARSFFAPAPDGSPPGDGDPGEQLGPYTLVEAIGEGASATVWLADQREPVQRQVALKILKPGLNAKRVGACFEKERTALATLDHPNIAPVFDSGTTQWGRPFFVTELVRGKGLTDHCDDARLPLAERLALFIQVCEAVWHAHEKGLVHHGLKPAKILVALCGGAAVPKIIDFGVALATQPPLSEMSAPGALLYLSPEHAEWRGVEIDARSDVFSLGVLLCELLTGRTPLDPGSLIGRTPEEIRRAIREQEPQNPSDLVRALHPERREKVACDRQTSGGRLCARLRGDLDAIVRKALQRNRTRRYATAHALALDLRRHLKGEPVAARAYTRLYRIERFVHRHRLTFAAAAVLAFAALAGWGVPKWAFHRVQEQRQAAEKQRRRAEAQAAQAREMTPRKQYAADIQLAAEALRAKQFDRARQLLDQQRPAPGAEDLRGWEWRWLWQQLREPAAPAAAGQMLAPDVVFAFLLPDGRTAYAVDTGGRRYLADLATLRQTPLPLTARTLGIFAAPNFLGFHDGKNRLALYEISERGAEPVAEVPVGPDLQRWIAYSPAQRTLAWAAGGAAIHVTNVDRPGESFDLESGGEIVSPASFDPTGRWLLGVGPQSDARVWDLAARERLPAAEAYFSPARMAVFGSARNALGSRSLADWITAASQPTIAQWLPENVDASADFPPRVVVTARAFSPDGRTFAVASQAGGIALFDAVRRKKLATLRSHAPAVFALAFSPDGTRLVSPGDALWDVTSHEELLRLPAAGTGHSIAQFSDDGSTLLVGSSPPGRFQFWRAPSREEIADVERRGGGHLKGSEKSAVPVGEAASFP